MVLAGAADQEAIDQVAERDDREPAAEYAEREAAGVAGDREADIAAEKIIGAVRHVHDPHQPEAEREAAREQEQERGEGDAVDRLKDAAVHERGYCDGDRENGYAMRTAAPRGAAGGRCVWT